MIRYEKCGDSGGSIAIKVFDKKLRLAKDEYLAERKKLWRVKKVSLKSSSTI